jgi:hypothetical protein
METLMLICIVVLLGLIIHLYSLLSTQKEMVELIVKTTEDVVQAQQDVNTSFIEYIVNVEEHLSCVNICIAELLKGEKQ